MNSLLTYLVVAALIDSINPNAIAVQIYLLTTPKPIKRSLAFIAGDFLANLITGLLITVGLAQLISQIFSRFNEIIYLFQLLLGITLVLLGCYFYKIFGQAKTIKTPSSLKPIYTFFLGVTIAFSEAPTALPYLAVIEKIIQKNPSSFQIINFLTIYNLIFIFPLTSLLLMHSYFQKESVALLDRIQLLVHKWFPRIMRIIVVIFGLVLIVDSIVYMSDKFLLME